MGFTKISHSYEMLFFGRFIIGVNCGKDSTLKVYMCMQSLAYYHIIMVLNW